MSNKRSVAGIRRAVPLRSPESFLFLPENLSRSHILDAWILPRFRDYEVVRVGYARVSRKDQRLEARRGALLADGCERVFEEKVSSREADRKALREAFDYCREGDVLVVARLDRLGRSLREPSDLVGELEGRGVGFRSPKESLDTTTAGGRLLFPSRYVQCMNEGAAG
jgi:hypothetical protein